MAGRQVDIVRGDLLIEIQTSGFTALKKKLHALLEDHPVRLVYPLALEKWIVRIEGSEGRVLGRRKSPKRGRLEDAFAELVRLAKLFSRSNFSFEVLFIREEEVRRHEAGRARRRKGWVIVERRLIDVVESRLLSTPGELLELLPPGLATPFSTAQLAEGLDVSRDLAQKMAYCLREAGAIRAAGKEGNARLYRPANPSG